MRKFIIAVALMSLLSACGDWQTSDPAAMRQGKATRGTMNAGDRKVGYPAVTNYSQRQVLKDAYEDMDKTVLTYVYAQGLDGKFICIGQAVGYSISMGTQFTAPEFPQYLRFGPDDMTADGTYMMAQPDPDGLYHPSSGSASVIKMIDPETGEASTSMSEPNLFTSPYRLPATVVSVACPNDIAAANVKIKHAVNEVK